MRSTKVCIIIIIRTLAVITLFGVTNASAGVSTGPIYTDTGDIIGEEVFIDGAINKATQEQFSEIMARKKAPSQLRLNSSGGSVIDAMQVGEIVRRNNMTIVMTVRDSCLSACVLILAAGVQRIPNRVGIHRPHFDESEFAKLSLFEARKAYEKMETDVRNYLIKMGMPDALFLAMRKISSDDIVVLSKAQIHDFGLDATDPTFAEYMRAKEIAENGKVTYDLNKIFGEVWFACTRYASRTHRDAPTFCDADVKRAFGKGYKGCVAQFGADQYVACLVEQVGPRLIKHYDDLARSP